MYEERTFNSEGYIPPEITKARQWICWQYKQKSPGTKPTKVPVTPKGGPLWGWESDPEQWMSFAKAKAAYERNPKLSGIGFVLTTKMGLVGVDMDNAMDLETGEVAPWAAAHIKQFDTWTEVSPSGKGFRMFVLGDLPMGSVNKVGRREIYTHGRWLTVTGRTWNESPLAEDRHDAIADYIKAMVDERGAVSGVEYTGGAGSNQTLVTEIIKGVNLHDNTTALAYRLVEDGMADGKVVETIRGLMQSMPDKGDQARWQDRYDDIPRAVSSAKAKQARAALPEPAGDHWGFVFADEMTRNLGPTRWLVQKLIPEDCTGVLYGASGSLKSFVMLDMALCIATGTTWQGKATKQRTVYYLAGEGEQGFAKRIAAWCKDRRLPASANFAFRQIPRIQDAGDMDKLVAAIRGIASERGQPAGLIVIDTLFTALDGGDENSGKDMGKIIAAMNRLRAEFGAAAWAVHHTGKIGDSARGHSSLPSGMDVMLFAKSGSTPLTVEVSNPKQKDGAEHPVIFLQASVVDLGIVGEDGKPETSLVLHCPSAALMAGFQSKSQLTQQRVAEAQEQRQKSTAASEQIKARALELMGGGATLKATETAIAELAEQLGYPEHARGKSTLDGWKKSHGL